MGDVARYEGRCEFCLRDIGTGHEQSCPYWQPPREVCRELLDVLTADDLAWLKAHGWQDPRTAPMPTGDAFLDAFHDPRLMSHEWR